MTHFTAPSQQRPEAEKPIKPTALASSAASATLKPTHASNAPPPAAVRAARKLTLTHHAGSLFAAPKNSVLIHACNTLGFWGSGIALAFKQAYPCAYAKYRSHCIHKFNPKTKRVPTGTCLLIPPCEGAGKPEHWIACLFTSAKTGKAKDKPEVVLQNTARAVKDLLRKVKSAREGDSGKRRMQVAPIGELRMCMINSGKFGVDWARTADVLQGLEVRDGEDGCIQVWAEEE